jgi:hypothetical protein
LVLFYLTSYVVSQLRAAYLQAFQDGVGERIIKPSHLYITKTGPRRLNNAAATLLSMASPNSPPIPTDSLQDRFPMRRGKPSSDDDDAEDQLPIGEFNRGAGGSRTIKGRRRASTLPSLRRDGTHVHRSIARGKSTEDLLGTGQVQDKSLLYSDLGSDESIATEDDTLTTVYENDLLYDDNNMANKNELGNDILYNDSDVDFDKDYGDAGDDDDDSNSDEDDQDEDIALSGLSEEDDSDIEEDLEYAAQQLKIKSAANPDDETSSTSGSKPASANPSPRAPRRANNSVSSGSGISLFPKARQRSLDVTGSSSRPQGPLVPSIISPNNGSVPNPHRSSISSRQRAYSTRTVDSNYSPQLAALRRADTLDSTVSASSSVQVELFPTGGFGSELDDSATTNSVATSVTAMAPFGGTGSTTLVGTGSTSSGLGIRSGSISEANKTDIFTGSHPMTVAIKPTPKTSNLSSQIRAKQASFDNPLEQYIAASGKSERRPLKLRMYMPSCYDPRTPWEVVIRTDVNVANAIGFALYCYTSLKREPPLPEELKDANAWNMRIVEDDGEPDEDFPALDRVRLISAFSFDEFALVRATPKQIKENEQITPNTKKPVAKRENGDDTGQESASDTYAEIRVYQYPFNDMISPVFWTRVVSSKTTMVKILQQVCEEKMMDENAYSLKIAGTTILVSSNMEVESLQGQYNLELTPRRVITKANGYEAPAEQITSSPSNARIYSELASRGAQAARAQRASGRQSRTANDMFTSDSLVAAGYQKYTIWRRQPMSFISRHERILAIDGEYVHIMPSEDKTWFDSPKTSSFHIGQIIKCKQSRKMPNNFKVVVMKTSGPKRYDLEAISPAQSAEIVSKLRRLALNYRN